MVKKKMSPHIITYNIVLRGLCDAGNVDLAMKVYKSMVSGTIHVEPDSWTVCTLVKGLCIGGRIVEAENIIRDMVEQKKLTDIAPHTMLIGAYLREGKIRKALSLWNETLELGFVPNSKIYSTLLKGFCRWKCMSLAKGVFSKMKAWGPSPTSYDYNSMMAALCQDGMLEQARAMFGDMIDSGCEPDVSSFNIMIASSLKAEDYPAANDLMVDMQGRGLPSAFEC